MVVELVKPTYTVASSGLPPGGSSGTENTDRVEKFREYAKCGILEYWIVDCDSASIEVYRLRRGGYFLFGKWKAGEVARSEAVKGFEVPVDQIIEM